jgi:hypothetical protein
MRISFHEDPVAIADICADLKAHGAVYWHSTRPGFRAATNAVGAQINVIPLCARPNGDFMDFLVRTDLATNIAPLLDQVGAAIMRWHELGEPVPHVEIL